MYVEDESHKWVKLSQIAKSFDVSSIRLGRILDRRGLRISSTKEATPKAIELGLAKTNSSNKNWVRWHKENLEKILIEEFAVIDEAEDIANRVFEVYKQAPKNSDDTSEVVESLIQGEIPPNVRDMARVRAVELIEAYNNPYAQRYRRKNMRRSSR